MRRFPEAKFASEPWSESPMASPAAMAAASGVVSIPSFWNIAMTTKTRKRM
jgi:hypothetical protein